MLRPIGKHPIKGPPFGQLCELGQKPKFFHLLLIRRCFLILRCRLFLSFRSRIRKVSDCSPANKERELGLDRRETG